MSLTIDLTPQEEARFADYARKRGLEPAPLAKTLITAITAPLPPVVAGAEVEENAGAALSERFGYLFGTVEGLPSDLSTNPKYMEGFGKDSGEMGP